jgi:hypothetical protein
MWAAKLTFEERCGFYYAHLDGVDRDIIAIASGLHRSTVTRLTNRSYTAYGEIHLKFDELGANVFRERYWTKDIQDRLAAARAQVAARRLRVHLATGPVHHAPAPPPQAQPADNAQQPPLGVHLQHKK